MATGSSTRLVSLSYRPPYDWDALIGFLAARATPGVELVEASCYRRTIAIGGQAGTIQITPGTTTPAIDREVRFADSRALPVIVERVRRMFDLGADPDAFLGEDLILKRMAGGGTARELELRSESWRPWRAYAVMLLWQGARDAEKCMDELDRLSPRSKHASGDRRRTGRGQEHTGATAR